MERRALAWWLGCLVAVAGAQEPALDEDEVRAAIERGLDWIESRQAADGSFDEGYIGTFPIGPTALSALTLIKGGRGESEGVEEAFGFIASRELTRTYGTGILLMAIEALYAPSPDELEERDDPYATVTRKQFKKAPRGLKKMLSDAATWLLKTRHRPLWGYPFLAGEMGGNEWDHSNTQYALLGLAAAARVGFKVKTNDLFEVLEQMLAGQEQDGPEVEPFFVPAADKSFAELDELQQDLAEARARAREGEPDDTVVRVRDFYESVETSTMKARGWAYLPFGPADPGNNTHGALGMPQYTEVNNSMTAASLAAVIILKSILEDNRTYQKRYARLVDQSIRDGVAWLTHHWTIDDPHHPYYYLYGLERVGVLTGLETFGEHDWYLEGGQHILAAQNADGSWGNAARVANGGVAATPNALPQTCFAILFLARATAPLVPDLPERPTTSGGE